MKTSDLPRGTSPDADLWVRSRLALKQAIPPALLNRALLRFPALYGLGAVNYETNLLQDGVDDLRSQLDATTPVEGDVIECGASRCGATVIAARHLAAQGSVRRITACDSFSGFDRSELERERASGHTDAPVTAFTSTSLEYVRLKLVALGVDHMVDLVPGYFEETLPLLRGPFSLAFVDCDLHDSVLFCANTLWPHIPPRGRMLFDDYASAEFRGARSAVDKFVAERAAEIAEHRMLASLYVVVKT